MIRFLPFGLATAAIALGAADAPQAVATLAWRHAPQDRIVVGDTLWRCAAERCQGPLVDRPAARARACRQLARYAGRVLKLETPSGALADEALVRCNKGLD